MNLRCRIVVAGVVAGLLTASTAFAQTVPPPRPVPFPTAGAPATPAAAEAPQAPAEGTLGAPIYPAAVFLESLDAGKGQRYHLYGTDAPFVDIVNYYKTTLKTGGRTLFQAPAMHQFDLGRFQEQTMAYPPSVVVKDYTWNGSEGYLHVSGTAQKRYRTIIQIVPPGGTRQP